MDDIVSAGDDSGVRNGHRRSLVPVVDFRECECAYHRAYYNRRWLHAGYSLPQGYPADAGRRARAKLYTMHFRTFPIIRLDAPPTSARRPHVTMR
jgi:hypothetical protein